MPNWMNNEVIFKNVDTAQQEAILAKCCDADGDIDFGILLPMVVLAKRRSRRFPGIGTPGASIIGARNGTPQVHLLSAQRTR
jgi:hypothetical protein